MHGITNHFTQRTMRLELLEGSTISLLALSST
jgi:hypothetical protein